MVSIRTLRPFAAKAALLLAPVVLTAACSQAPADNTAELQAKLAAAEARATAAEKRVKTEEAADGMHYQQSVAANSGAQADPAQQADNTQGESQFGQPMIDTAPIDTAPVAPPQTAPGGMSN